jgi:hypothetical protein
MDPYLEGRWQDVHQSVCTYARDQLQEQLGGELVARLGERLIVESLSDRSRSIYPDVRVVEHGLGDMGLSTATAAFATALAEPVVVEVASDPEPQGFIEIIEPDSGTLVTVIEFISPTNKLAGDGRRQYASKQRELDAAQVSLVEIDLIRAGKRCFMLPESQIPRKSRAAYVTCVFRGYRPGKFEIYGMPLRRRLPAIRIPLRRADPDVALDIQLLIDLAYRNGRYDLTDYCEPCIPPLEGADAAWADKLLRAAGRR